MNGWIVRLIDKLPEAGDTFTYKSSKKVYTGKVTKADERKALEIILKVKDIPEGDTSEAPKQ